MSLTTPSTHLARLRTRWVLAATMLFCCMTMLAGPLRMYLSMVGLTPLIYIPNLMMLIAAGWQVIAAPGRQGWSAVSLLALVTVGYATLVGLLYLPVTQVAMGFYVLIPFWFGLTCAPLLARHWSSVRPFIGPSFAIAAGGVILNQFVTN